MFKYFFKSKEWRTWAYGGGAFLLISVWIQVQFTVWLNEWYKGFYDLFSEAEKYYDKPNEGVTLFVNKIISIDYLFTMDFASISFVVLATPWIFLMAFTSWFTRIYALRWRQAITFGYIPRWQSVEEEIEGASQRIQEDAAKFAAIVESLGLGAVRAILTLIAFTPILWELSSKVDVPILRDIEGSLVWAALFFSVGGLLVSWFVGIKLPGLEYNIQREEAAFRKDLVLGEDNKAVYAQTTTLIELFTGVKFCSHRLYINYTYFDLWLSFYGQLMSLGPYLVMAPSLFTGAILMGTMIQVSNAFGKVHGGFAYLVDNWTRITELRSIYKRLTEFEKNLTRYEKQHTALAD